MILRGKESYIENSKIDGFLYLSSTVLKNGCFDVSQNINSSKFVFEKRHLAFVPTVDNDPEIFKIRGYKLC